MNELRVGLRDEPDATGGLVASEYDPMFDKLTFDLGDRLAKSLRVADVGVQDMADFLGVSRATIANWTSGRTIPTVGAQRAWALKTGVPYEWLSTGEMPYTAQPGQAGTKKSFLSESNRRPSHYKADHLEGIVRKIVPQTSLAL